jgi:rubredoxin-NAD+ reductase
VERGIVVDEYGASSDPAIFAIGDCAQYGARLLPYVQPIMTAARAIAATLAGTPTPLRFGPMPVIVKTPACPAVILPPSETDGEWLTTSDSDGLEMRYLDADQRLRGFVLLGSAAPRRGELLRQIAA